MSALYALGLAGMSRRELVDELVISEYDGRVMLGWFPVPPDDAPFVIREGIARQRIAATTGACPCGAVAQYGEPEPGGPGVGEVWHRRTCPGDAHKLAKAIRRWLA